MIKKKLVFQYWDYIFVFISVCVLFGQRLFQFCTHYKNLVFDSQALLLWDFVANQKNLAITEIFYPYGLLPYFKNQNVLFHTLFFSVVPSICFVIYFTFKKIWKDTFFSITSFIFFLSFVVIYSQVDTLGRYGTTMAAGCLLAYASHTYKKLQKRFLVISGICTGLILIFSFDQGIFMLSIYSFFFIMFPLFRYGFYALKTLVYFSNVAKYFIFYFCGFVISLLPSVLYLVYIGSFLKYLTSIIHIFDLTLYAKTPFTPYVTSPANIFVLFALTVSLIYIGISFGKRKKKSLSLADHLLIYLVIVLILFEQKSIIRSIDQSFLFIGFFLLLILLSEVKNYIMKLEVSRYAFFLYYILTVSILIFLNPFQLNNVQAEHRSSLRNDDCIAANIHHLVGNYPEYGLVIEVLKKSPGFSEKVFSFPSDPFFYVLLNQVPPYHFNSYDASSIYAQNSQIEYIEKNNIEYIIYNTQAKMVQDHVPEYIRANKTLSHILTNYEIYKEVDSFLLLKRKKKPSEFFTDKVLKTYPFIEKYFLFVNLSAIPFTEGKYKARYLERNDIVYSAHSVSELNDYLKTHTIYSKNIILMFKANEDIKPATTITIKTDSTLQTEITFRSCPKAERCVINISRLPLFFFDRIIRSVELKKSFEGEITLYRTKSNMFW